MALAGVASADTAPTVVWDMDFTSAGIVINTAEGVTTDLTTGVGTSIIKDGAITLNNDKFSFNQTAGQLSYADEFTLVAKIQLGKQPGSWPVIMSLGEDANWYWKPSYYTAGKFVLDKDGFGTGATENDDTGISYTLPTEDGSYGDIITLAFQNDGKGNFTLYVDGKLADSTIIADAGSIGSNKLVKQFTFGGRNGSGNNKANVIFHDVQFVNGLVTQIVPEPTTATLSLLALAGLAARRRRK